MEIEHQNSIVTLLNKLKDTVEQGNYDSFAIIGTSITYFSLPLDLKMGILIGEVLESTFIQLERDISRTILSTELLMKELSNLTPHIQELIDAVNTDNTSGICLALAEIRYFATNAQFNFPGKYKKQVMRRGIIR